jgi:hypothetical protein
LARHSDIRLTMNVYTHIELHDQQEAIESLPGPATQTTKLSRDMMDSEKTADPDDVGQVNPVVPKTVPRSAKNGAIELALMRDETASVCTECEDLDRGKLKKTAS